jgi:hypothetical protein
MWLLGLCFLREAPERANGPDRPAGRSLGEDWGAGKRGRFGKAETLKAEMKKLSGGRDLAGFGDFSAVLICCERCSTDHFSKASLGCGFLNPPRGSGEFEN